MKRILPILLLSLLGCQPKSQTRVPTLFEPTTLGWDVYCGFQFTVPSKATVKGIEVLTARDVENVHLRIGHGDASTGIGVIQEGIIFYGGKEDLWGVDATPNMVNGDDFCFAFTGDLDLTEVQMTVHYK